MLLMRRAGWLCSCALAMLRCTTPATSLLVEVSTDLPWGESAVIDRVRVRVRDDTATRPAEEFALGRGRGRVSVPFSFGVIPRDGATSGSVRIEVSGCRGSCDTDAVVTAVSIASFAPRETRSVRVFLGGRCRYVTCADGATCDASTGACVDATRTMTAPTASATVSVGLGQSCVTREDGAVSCWGDRVPGRALTAGSDDRAPRESRGDVGAAYSVALGVSHACALTRERSVRCWGDNTYGQLGDGSTASSASPVTALTAEGAPLSNVAEVGVGWDASCARTVEGAVRCWGRNASGQLGDGTAESRARAVAVSLEARADQLSVGFGRACAVLSTGAVWCWGRGVGAAPSRVVGVSAAAEVRVGWRHACARLRDGTVTCWGDNTFGQLGRGDLAASSEARSVNALRDVVALSASGFHTCALRSDATLLCWGRNDLGQLGDGSTQTRPAPVSTRAAGVELARVRAVAAGVDHTCALVDGDRAARTLCWGGDLHGELGTGRALSRAAPQPVAIEGATALSASQQGTCASINGVAHCWGTRDPGWSPGASGGAAAERARVVDAPTPVAGLAAPFTHIAAGRRHTCARSADGAVLCWGSNDRGQLASAEGDALVPRRVDALLDAQEVVAGESHTCARVERDRVRCWGANESSQLGDGSAQDRASPTAVNLAGITALTAGDRFSCALTRDGAVWCWGALGGAAPAGVPTRVVMSGASAVAAGSDHVCVLRDDRTVACWGDNSHGQLGGSLEARVVVPTEVAGLGDVVEIRAGGGSTCARISDGSVRCWGRNDHGQLGARDATETVVTVPGARDAVAIAVGVDAACALSREGTVSCWGEAEFGALGSVQRDRVSSPAQVLTGEGRPLDGVSAIFAGDARACAIRSGVVWCWGAGDYGQLGDGVARERPELVSVRAPDGAGDGVSDAISLAAGARHACLVRTDGRLACWGSNGDGRLGDGTRLDRSTPAYVALPTARFSAVSAGERHTCALDRDGAVWCWGANDRAQLGASGASSDVPRRVALPSSASSVSAGGDSTCALLTNSRVACWGANDRAQLGRGDTVAHPDIVEVIDASGGPIRDAVQVSVGDGHACVERAGMSVWCWGDDAVGQVTGTPGAAVARATRWSAAPFNASSRTIHLAAGRGLTCVSTIFGENSYCWGANAAGRVDPEQPFGAIGPSNVVGAVTPEQFETFGIGRDFLCLTSDFMRPPFCNGSNEYGQRGVGTRAPIRGPLEIIDGSALRVVASGESFSCGIGVDASRGVRARCWGRNEAGQLGGGFADGRAWALPTLAPSGTRAVSVGTSHRCALLDDGTVRCWGSNQFAQLGSGTLTDHARPLAVLDVSGAASLASGTEHTCAVLRDGGNVRCWGRNDALQLGEFNARVSERVMARGVLGATLVTAGAAHTCALLRDGRVACWGDRTRAQLGDGDPTAFASLPVVVPGVARATALAAGGGHTCAVDGDGVVLCWGDNLAGQLGDGTRSMRARPTPVIDAERAVIHAVDVGASRDLGCEWRDDGALSCAVSDRDFSCARHRDGRVSCWGDNRRGQLGDGARASRSFAASVAGITDARAITVGARHACAETSTGWVCWGDNRDGALGDGVSVVRTEAVAVE